MAWFYLTAFSVPLAGRSMPARPLHALIVSLLLGFLLIAGLRSLAAAEVAPVLFQGEEAAGDEGDVELPGGIDSSKSVLRPTPAVPEPAATVIDEGNQPVMLVPEAEREEIDPEELQRRIDEAVEREVTRRLAGIPRPMYIPATDIAPPKGLLLYAAKKDSGKFPFALALDGYLQFRWLELARGVTQWTDSAGTTLPVRNENDFNINRFLLGFSGFVGGEQVAYNFSLFGTTNAGLFVNVVPVGLLALRFSEDLLIGGGVTQVPGSREWLISSRWPMGVDRSMANTFFRPSYSPGFMSIGALFDKLLHYHAGVYNGIDGGEAGLFRSGTAMAWSGNIWLEPLGPYGHGYSDMEHHDNLVLRVGTSGTYARTPATILDTGVLGGFQNPENTVLRLSDGTPIGEPGALGAGTRVKQLKYRLATVDAGFKYRGFSGFLEYYWRFLNDFVGDGQFDRQSLFDQGGSAFLGYCLVPRTWEVYGRTSALTGPYGTAQEYGGGLNWYLNKTRQNRFTIEGLYINRSPALNFIYPYRAGFTGAAIQTQYMVVF